MSSTTTVSHPGIGKITASAAKDGVLQFLGLQYATVADRFAPAVMKEYDQGDTIDATKLGPQVLSLVPGPDMEHTLIQHTVDYDHSQVYMSDTEGLVLNITVPKDSQQDGTLDSDRKLPVFAFIHGGGFMNGSGMFPHYDMARFIQLSVREGRPCIGVVLNYRLGAPGLLTSASLREAGYKPNNTFRDQRTALLWLQKHIAGFGGDPENVTLTGESAGGISVSYHLFSKEPLFKRMMSMSGTALLMPPIPAEAAQENYRQAIKALGLADGEGAVKGVTTMDGGEMTKKLMQTGVPFMPVLDDDMVPTTFDFASIKNGETTIPGQQWCEAALIGDCQLDGNIQGLRLMNRKKGIAAEFTTAISKGLIDTPMVAAKLLLAYDLKPWTEDEEAFFKVLQVANDLNFYVPTLMMAEDLSRHMKTYMYRFNEPNPWEGRWKGHATHVLDIAFLLQNFNDFLEGPQKEVAEKFATDVIAFVSSKDPWKGWSEGEKVAKVFGAEGKMEVTEDTPEKVGRKSIMLELGEEVGFDKLNDAFNKFMRPAPPPV